MAEYVSFVTMVTLVTMVTIVAMALRVNVHIAMDAVCSVEISLVSKQNGVSINITQSNVM